MLLLLLMTRHLRLPPPPLHRLTCNAALQHARAQCAQTACGK